MFVLLRIEERKVEGVAKEGEVVVGGVDGKVDGRVIVERAVVRGKRGRKRRGDRERSIGVVRWDLRGEGLDGVVCLLQ